MSKSREEVQITEEILNGTGLKSNLQREFYTGQEIPEQTSMFIDKSKKAVEIEKRNTGKTSKIKASLCNLCGYKHTRFEGCS